MHINKSIDYQQERKFVSKLFFAVLTGKLSVREALAKFPKDCEDTTVIASWYALCHLEADEDIRLRDKMYREEQDDYIQYIAFTLEKGEALPSNIINEYKPFYSEALTPHSKSFKGIIKTFKKFLSC